MESIELTHASGSLGGMQLVNTAVHTVDTPSQRNELQPTANDFLPKKF